MAKIMRETRKPRIPCMGTQEAVGQPPQALVTRPRLHTRLFYDPKEYPLRQVPLTTCALVRDKMESTAMRPT